MISIVIVNHNGKEYLEKCLESIRAQTLKASKVIVIDNASNDDTVKMVRNFYPEVRLVCNSTNLLFSKAYNQGIKESDGNFILCINNDIVLDRNYLKEVYGSIKIDNGIGMVSGKILRMDDNNIIDSTGLFVGHNRKAIERGYGKKDKGQYKRAGYVFGVSGSCIFMKREMLIDIEDKNGYFDETFGMYYEDLDLCWRAQKKGWKAYYNPKAIAYHKRGATSVRQKINSIGRVNFIHLTDELRKKYIINRYKCIIKNDTLFGFIFNLPFILIYDVTMLVYLLLKKIASPLRGSQ